MAFHHEDATKKKKKTPPKAKGTVTKFKLASILVEIRVIWVLGRGVNAGNERTLHAKKGRKKKALQGETGTERK